MSLRQFRLRMRAVFSSANRIDSFITSYVCPVGAVVRRFNIDCICRRLFVARSLALRRAGPLIKLYGQLDANFYR